jgi:hypothetical protein
LTIVFAAVFMGSLLAEQKTDFGVNASDAGIDEKTVSRGKLSKSVALGIDLVSGRCQLQEMSKDLSGLPGFKLIGLYDSAEHAKAAALRATDCQGRVRTEDEISGSERKDASDCRQEISVSKSNLLGLLSRPRANDHTLFVACMRARGHGASQ